MRAVHKRLQAQLDIAEQARFIADDSPEAARRFLKAVEDTLALLSEMPSAGAGRRFSNPALQGIRMLPVKGFDRHLIFYRPAAEGIELIRVYHSARDPNQLALVEQDEVIRTRLKQVEQGAPLIPHEKATRYIEELLRGQKPDKPEAA